MYQEYVCILCINTSIQTAILNNMTVLKLIFPALSSNYLSYLDSRGKMPWLSAEAFPSLIRYFFSLSSSIPHGYYRFQILFFE